MYATMLITKRPHIDPSEFIDSLPKAQFPQNEQQDVAEFARYVFDKLGGCKQTLIRKVFAGDLSEVTRCSVCNFEKRRPETFTDIILIVPKYFRL